MTTALQAVLLDVDGTLADTEEIHRQAFNASFADNGLDWEWSRDLYRELLAVTGGKERIRYFLEREQPEFELPPNDVEWIAGLHARKTECYVEALSSGTVPLRPGVERLLRDLRDKGLRLAIATTTTPDNVDALLAHSFSEPAQDWFEVIAAGSIVPQKKPAPDIYNHTLQAMQLLPAQCIALEDSRNGLLSAMAAHVPTLITINDWTDAQDFTGAAAVLDQLGEPGSPCRLLAGQPGPEGLVDATYLAELHCRAISY